MSDPAPAQQYPAWLLRFNRVITSRPVTYFAAVLFALEGVPRLLDGRVIRGVGTLAIAAALVVAREGTRRAAIGEDEVAERRAQWLADHPVIGALFAGTASGAAMGLYLVVTQEGPIVPALLIGLGSGLLLFGPSVVLMDRRWPSSDRHARRP